MEKTEQLKEIISNYWQLPAFGMDWDTELNHQHLKNFSSLRLLRFFSSVEEHLKICIEDPDAIKRFRDLLPLVEP